MFWRRAADAEIPNPDLVDEAAKVADQTAAGGAQAPHLGLKLARELESEALPWACATPPARWWWRASR